MASLLMLASTSMARLNNRAVGSLSRVMPVTSLLSVDPRAVQQGRQPSFFLRSIASLSPIPSPLHPMRRRNASLMSSLFRRAMSSTEDHKPKEDAKQATPSSQQEQQQQQSSEQPKQAAQNPDQQQQQEQQQQQQQQPPPPPPPPPPRNPSPDTPNMWYVLAALGILGAVMASSPQPPQINPQMLTWEELSRLLRDKEVEKIVVHEKTEAAIKLMDHRIGRMTVGSGESFVTKLEELQASLGIPQQDFIQVTFKPGGGFHWRDLLIFPLFLGTFYILSMMGSRGRFGFGQMMDKLKPISKAKTPEVSFADIAGLDEAKQEVLEFVQFLQNPEKFEAMGAKIPKGALFIGPPGTGKTLLAKAVAKEANVNFIYAAGSDFIEMFVGVGPARIRNLFAEARNNSPCIIFIDEIDTIGKKRNGSMRGMHEEAHNTLNSLLVEMDGFTPNTKVIVMAGTNRAEILDPALLRPGRFDRQIQIGKPDLRARAEILKVHLKKLQLDLKSISMNKIADNLAALTPGLAGAELAAICNEGAIIAARKDAPAVSYEDLKLAVDRVLGGIEKKNLLLSPDEKERVAYHESGHALAGWFLEHAQALLKVSIVPRGRATLGFAQYLPKEQFLYTQEQLEDTICVALAGRAAEVIKYGSLSTGAQDDLMKVTRIAYSQIENYGMSSQIGPIAWREQNNSLFVEKPFSEDVSEKIDLEVRAMVDRAYKRTEQLIRDKVDLLERLAQRLTEKEVLEYNDLVEVLGPRPYPITDASVKAFLEGSSEPEKVEEPVPQVDPGIEVASKPEWAAPNAETNNTETKANAAETNNSNKNKNNSAPSSSTTASHPN